tara:strand:- start:976 stop:1512 length:537 start_codon:yes stop_codon:yes gene_type:complete
MPFKINISNKGKTYKVETESETVVGKKIGETIKGEDISADLAGYELEITGISDIAGLPGFKGLEGAAYHRRLLTRGPGMHNTTKGIRLRKTNRGEEISLKISQINTKVIKEGKTKFADLGGEAAPAEGAEKPAEEKPAEQPKEEKPAPAETAKPEEPKQEEKPVEEKKEEAKPEEKKE